MKKLIKLIIAFVLVFSTANVHAQSFGIKGGLSFSNMYFDDGVETYSFDMNPGFVFGPTAEFSLVENLSLETGLLLNTKGFKESESETYNSQTYEFNRKMTLYYMDVPITLKPSYDLNGIKLFGNIGPYIGIGLSGKYKSEWIEGDEVDIEEEDVEFGSDEDEDHLKRLDYGLLIGAGVEIKSIELGLSYGHGLANISTYTDDDEKINNRVLRVTAGYKF